MINELADILIDTVLVAMIIIFGTSFLFLIRVIIEDIKQHNEDERRLNNGNLCRHKRK